VGSAVYARWIVVTEFAEGTDEYFLC
jgi:hypothetical protein